MRCSSESVGVAGKVMSQIHRLKYIGNTVSPWNFSELIAREFTKIELLSTVSIITVPVRSFVLGTGVDWSTFIRDCDISFRQKYLKKKSEGRAEVSTVEVRV